MQSLSVTRVLSPFNDFSAVPPDRLELASKRGQAVHAACAAYARRLPIFYPDGSQGYVESFINWYDAHVKRPLFIEAEFSDPRVYKIHGHPDLVCEMADGRIAVIDYKTPAAESRTWRSQLAAYIYLVKPVVGDAVGMAVRLPREGGEARVSVYERSAEDFAAFVAALTAYRYFKGGKK